MKNKKQIKTVAISILIAAAVILAVFMGIKLIKQHLVQTGYGDAPNSANQYEDPLDMYSITKTGNFTYAYQVVDKNSTVLFSGECNSKTPDVTQINDRTLEVTLQTGTGRSTNWAVYCDVENSRLSETFQYVLMAQGDYVIYADYNNDEPYVVIQNIFDKSEYYKEYVLTNCSPFAGDIVLSATLDGEGHAVITYLTGEDYTETELVIPFP